MNVTEKNLLIETKTGQYPLNIRQVQSRITTHSFGETVDPEVLKELGYEVVEPVEKPVVEGAVFREDKPVLVNGVYKQTFVQVQQSEKELAEELVNQKVGHSYKVNASLEAALNKGAPYNFGTEKAPVINHVQLRAADRTNLLILLEAAKLLPEQAHPLRTYEDVVYYLPGQKINDIVVSAFNYYGTLMRKSWVLKDLVEISTNVGEFPEVPEILVP